MPAYSKTTWVNGSSPAINATNLNNIEDGIEQATPIQGQTSVGTSSFTTSTVTGFTRQADVTVSGVTAADTPFVSFITSSYNTASIAGITLSECYAGGIRLYAAATPSTTVTFDYIVIKG